jgi:hypothetical protein
MPLRFWYARVCMHVCVCVIKAWRVDKLLHFWNTYVCINAVCVYVCCLCAYMYICLYIHICVCIHTYIYIYIYITYDV